MVGVASTSAVEGEEAACSTLCSGKSLATGAMRGRPLREEARGEESGKPHDAGGGAVDDVGVESPVIERKRKS